MAGPSSCVIGCNLVREKSGWHTIVSTAGTSAYLVRGKPEIGILPHGTGHKLVEDQKLNGVILTPEGVLWNTVLPGGSERLVYHYNAVPTTSRESVFSKVESFGLIQEGYAVLEPLCSVKV